MSKFRPMMYQKSIYDIDYNKLYDSGIKCILFDVDNTCCPYHEKNPSKRLITLFKRLKKIGFRVVIFSNAKKKRLETFDVLDVDINYLSKKPLSGNFKRVLRKYGYDSCEVIIIGDQIFTDIYGGNNVGINTCLVEPLTDEDFFVTRFFRWLEKIMFNKLGLVRGKYYE